MKRLILSAIVCCACTLLYSQTADDYYLYGDEAFNSGDDVKAEQLLLKAAEMGSEKACGLLSFMYFCGALNHERDTEEAMGWAQRVVTENDPYSSFVKGMVEIYRKNYENAIPRLEYVLQYMDLSEAKTGLSVCYYKLGNTEKAEQYALAVYNKYKDSAEKNNAYFSCCALLAKMAYDKDKRDMRAMQYSMETSKSSCPLGQYVMGRCQIESKMFPEIGKQIGKQRIARAANYQYWKGLHRPNLYGHLELFKEEIVNYYKKKVR